MNQNVDENEEYEQISKANKNLETNSILNESLIENSKQINTELEENRSKSRDSG